jgi:hypothetical protein
MHNQESNTLKPPLPLHATWYTRVTHHCTPPVIITGIERLQCMKQERVLASSDHWLLVWQQHWSVRDVSEAAETHPRTHLW